MTEKSYLWTTGGAGDGASTYTRSDWTKILKIIAASFDDEGVVRNFLNELAGTAPAVNTARIASGAALVDGKPYENSASVDVDIPSAVGAGNTRIDRIVLRAGWAAQTVRITRIAGTDALSPTAPVITQTSETTYDIMLYQVLVDTSGALTLTDERIFSVIGAGMVTNGMIADGAVTETKIGASAVTGDKIADASITATKMVQPKPYYCSLEGGTQNIPISENTKLTYSSEIFDSDTMHDTSSNTSRITIKRAGRYFISAHVQFAQSAVGVQRILYALKNNSSLRQLGSGKPNNGVEVVSGVCYLNLAANDYLEISVLHDSTGGLNVVRSYFDVVWDG